MNKKRKQLLKEITERLIGIHPDLWRENLEKGLYGVASYATTLGGLTFSLSRCFPVYSLIIIGENLEAFHGSLIGNREIRSAFKEVRKNYRKYQEQQRENKQYSNIETALSQRQEKIK